MVERSPNSREIEIKLELERRATSSLRSEIALLSASAKTTQLVSRYYDTRDQVVRKSGFTCRIRKVDETWVQTIKAEGGSVAGLYDRQEWETELATESLDYAAIAQTGLGQSVDMQSLDGKLEPIFETHIERKSWRMFLDDSDIEVALDEGLVKAGAATSEITELELELKRGSLAALFELARRLGPSGRGQIGVMTKAERGYALLDGGKRKAVKVERPPISRGLTTGQTVKIIAHSCIRQFRLNQSLIEEGEDAEALHQARVSIRRLRSLLSIFRKIVTGKDIELIKARLKNVFRELGRARNLDVYLEKHRSKGEDQPEHASLATPAAREREDAYRRLRDTLNAPEFRALMLDLLAWIETGSWLNRRPKREKWSTQPIEEFATKALDGLWRKLSKGGPRLERLDQDALHRLRIQAKKLRYACEFFGGIFDAGRAKKRYRVFLEELGKVQDCLGELNDLSTSHSLTTEFAKGAGEPSLAGASMASPAQFSESHAERADALLASAGSAFKALLDTKRFW